MNQQIIQQCLPNFNFFNKNQGVNKSNQPFVQYSKDLENKLQRVRAPSDIKPPTVISQDVSKSLNFNLNNNSSDNISPNYHLFEQDMPKSQRRSFTVNFFLDQDSIPSNKKLSEKLKSLKSLKKIPVKSKDHFQSLVTLIDRKGQIKTKSPEILKEKTKRGNLTQSYIKSFIKNLIKKAYIWRNFSKIQQEFLSENYSTDKNEILSDQTKGIFFINLWKPFHPFSIIWDVIKFILLILSIFWVTLLIGYKINKNEFIIISENFGLSFLAFDILIQMKKTYFFQGQLIQAPKTIIVRYLKNDFLRDFFCFLLLAILFRINEIHTFNNFINPEIVMVILYIYFTNEKFKKDLQNYQGQQPNEIIKLLVIIILIAHIQACLLHYITLHLESEPWSSIFEGKNILTRYMFCLNWSVSMLSLNGNSLFTINRDVDYFFSTLSMMISVMIFGYSLNIIGISIVRQRSHKIESQIQLINKYMAKNQIDFELQCRIRNYLEFSSHHEFKDDQLSGIIQGLNADLRQELLFTIRSKTLEQCPLLWKNFSNSSIKKLASSMEAVTFQPSEIIFQQGDFLEKNLFIIYKGDVQLLDSAGRIIKSLNGGECFGERLFFAQLPRNLTAKSNGFSQIYSIERDQFLEIILNNQNDKDMFCYIRDLILTKGNLAQLYHTCFSCESSEHYFENCPTINYKPDVERVIKQYEFYSPQFREDQFRRPDSMLKRVSNALNLIRFVQERLKQLQQDQDIDVFINEQSQPQLLVTQQSSGSSDDSSYEESQQGPVTSASQNWIDIGKESQGTIQFQDGTMLSVIKNPQHQQEMKDSSVMFTNTNNNDDYVEEKQFLIDGLRIGTPKNTAQFYGANQKFKIKLKPTFLVEEKTSLQVPMQQQLQTIQKSDKKIRDEEYPLIKQVQSASSSSINFQQDNQSSNQPSIISQESAIPNVKRPIQNQRITFAQTNDIEGEQTNNYFQAGFGSSQVFDKSIKFVIVKSLSNREAKEKKRKNSILRTNSNQRNTARLLPQIKEEKSDQTIPIEAKMDEIVSSNKKSIKSATNKRSQSYQQVVSISPNIRGLPNSLKNLSSKVSSLNKNTQGTLKQFNQWQKPSFIMGLPSNNLIDITQYEINNHYSELNDFEILCESIIYFPQNNYRLVIKSYNRRKIKTNLKNENDLNKYSFDYEVQLKMKKKIR